MLARRVDLLDTHYLRQIAHLRDEPVLHTHVAHKRRPTVAVYYDAVANHQVHHHELRQHRVAIVERI